MSSYRQLEIYKISKDLAVRIHRMTMTLSKFELYEEGSQVRRSSKAVTSAIVEGYGRRIYKAEFLRYLTICIAECDETILHLDFLFETGSLKDEKIYKDLSIEYQQLTKRINSFIQWANKNWLTGK